MKLYGIANCDTVKKARRFLAEANVDYEFHDYKKKGVDEAALRAQVAEFGWEKILNTRGTTWRKQPDEVKEATANEEAAIALMLAEPSIIKRPILEADGRRLLGFDLTAWEIALAAGDLK
ncbi:Spx/MgsR family transcriptional regulator [Breoghania corrubedonensis]|uniref:Spx/MgsR family transcriptional regulator n=1 Tax=Breoghania corrubedonensis TaxID=665038 RepID=A0A2T5VGF0_9HYPH|nr:ArsC family reductase [Breoghania corrubedonensis]PTW62815.1 Spx/MgsR family transcriptional regulator [Breoghania corrubedonensis]